MDSSVFIPANPAIHSFGIAKVIDSLVRFCESHPEMPLVSVGCGIAVIERGARSRVKNDFFLVDPAPNSFYRRSKDCHRLVVQYGMPATHSYTTELITTNPEIATGGECILFLNWCNYGDDDYDLEAVRLLKPRAIFAIVDTDEHAGSRQFHRFLKTTDQYRVKKLYSVVNSRKEKYACAHQTICMQWLVLSSTDRCHSEPQKETIQCRQVHDDQNIQNLMVLTSNKETQGDASLQLQSLIKDVKLLIEKHKDSK